MTPINHIKKATSLLSLIALVVACFAFAPQMQAVSPPPDGCYPGLTTAEGCNALALLEGGKANTAVGWHSLFSAGDVNFNTAVGAGALALTTTGGGFQYRSWYGSNVAQYLRLPEHGPWN